MLLPKQIVALGKVVARAAGRLSPSTVRIERHEGGPRAVATEGRRAVIFQWDEPEPGNFPAIEGFSPRPVRHFAANIPPNVLADASRGVAKRTPNPALAHLLLGESNAADVRVAARAGNNVTRTQAKAVDGAFPDCDSVLPVPARERNLYDPARHGATPFTHTRIGVNARQFAQTLQVVSDLAADDANTTVVMTVPVDPHRPIRLDARCSGRRAAAAIMPVHAQFDQYDDPVGQRHPAKTPRPRAKPLPAPASPPTAPAAPAASTASLSSRPKASPVRRPRRMKKPPLELGSGVPGVAPSDASWR